MFDIDELLTQCQEAMAENEPRQAVRDVVQSAIERPTEVAEALNPTEAGSTYSTTHPG